MLDALERQGLAKNTIIVLWGDHGWHLGDHGMWCKHTNYELATRSRCSWPRPEHEARAAQRPNALVEFVDIYPTLCELAGLALPKHLEGRSFMPLLTDPDQAWKTAAFSQFPSPALREWAARPLTPAMRGTYFGPIIAEVEARLKREHGDRYNADLFNNHVMGYSIRTERYRYTAWLDRRDANIEPLAEELYDHDNDPHETVNVAKANPEVTKTHLRDNCVRSRNRPDKEIHRTFLKTPHHEIPKIIPSPSQCARLRDLARTTEATDKPNILLIVSDDHGYGDVGFQGCKDIPTPHLDKLAAEGMHCTSGYVSHPFCSPTRAGLMTGRYQHRFGHQLNPYYNPDDHKEGLPLSEELLPEYLGKAGYKTGWIGKWHLGAAPEFRPENRGFAETFGFIGGGHKFLNWEVNIKNEYTVPIQRNGKPVEVKEHLTPRWEMKRRILSSDTRASHGSSTSPSMHRTCRTSRPQNVSPSSPPLPIHCAASMSLK